MRCIVICLFSVKFCLCSIYLCSRLFSIPVVAQTQIQKTFSLRKIHLPHSISAIAFSSAMNTHTNVAMVALASYHYIYLYDLKTHKTIQRIAALPCSTSGIAFSLSGNYLSATQRDCQARKAKQGKASQKIQVWQFIKNNSKNTAGHKQKSKQKSKQQSKWTTRLLSIGEHRGYLAVIAIDPSEKYLISMAKDASRRDLLRLWSLPQKGTQGQARLLQTRNILHAPLEHLALNVYALSYDQKILAIQNWQDYYMLLYRLPVPNSTVKKLSFLHRSEYPFGKKQALFAFSTASKSRVSGKKGVVQSKNFAFYFDGLRLRRYDSGKLLAHIRYHSNGKPIFSHLHVHKKKVILAVAMQLKNRENRYVIDFYTFPLLLKSTSHKGSNKKKHPPPYMRYHTTLPFPMRPRAVAFHTQEAWLGIVFGRRQFYLYKYSSL